MVRAMLRAKKMTNGVLICVKVPRLQRHVDVSLISSGSTPRIVGMIENNVPTLSRSMNLTVKPQAGLPTKCRSGKRKSNELHIPRNCGIQSGHKLKKPKNLTNSGKEILLR